MNYPPPILRDSSPESISSLIPACEEMLVSVMEALQERYEADPEYLFINSKLSVLDGRDFNDAQDTSCDFKGKSAIFGWIQGRGLESLVGHATWIDEARSLDRDRRDRLKPKLAEMVKQVFANLEGIRQRNFGHLSFLMNPDGIPFEMDDSGMRMPISLEKTPSRMSDLFYVKGMMAAARFLKDTDKENDAKAFFRTILTDIDENRFQSDQISFDPKNRVAPVPGRHGHGVRMIAVGGLALFYELTQEDEWLDKATDYVSHILDGYVNHDRFPELQPYDFFEFRDAQGNPWKEERGLLSDPGHALEFLGLAAKLLLKAGRNEKRSSAWAALYDRCVREFPPIFVQNFDNGFNRQVGGICKAFDLLERKPINSDMPWWSLPETMRTAAEMLLLPLGEKDQESLWNALKDCMNGLFQRFVNPRVYYMAYQTLDKHGTPVDVIPATPDADPGYHTGLSIIDFLRCIKSLAP